MSKGEQVERIIQLVQAALKAVEEELPQEFKVPQQAAVGMDSPEVKEIVRQALYGYQRDGAFRKPGENAAGGAEPTDLNLKEEFRQAMFGYRRNEKFEKV